MTRTRYRFFETEYPYLLTCTVVGWLPVFNRPECAAVVLDSLRHMHESGRFTLYVEIDKVGRYQLRALDPASGVTSDPFVLVVKD